MKATDLPPPWRRVLAAHAALGRMGFDPADMHVFFGVLDAARNVVNPAAPGEQRAFVRIEQGALHLDIDCGPIGDEPAPKVRWTEAVRAWNATDQAGRDHVFRETYNATMFALLGAALASEGMRPPAVPAQRIN